jgi:uncharacterized protein DUF3108
MPRARASASACWAVALALLLGVVGCALERRPGAPAPVAPSVLLPLVRGNEWVYEVRYPAGEVSKLTMRVMGERYIESRGMAATIVEESGGIPGSARLEASSDLVAYYLRGGFIFRSPLLIARDWGLEDRGAELGDERLLPVDPERDPAWESAYGLFDLGTRPLYEFHASSRLAPAVERVSVPAGVFERCVRVETSVSATTPSAPTARTIVHTYVEWYAPRVGLVRSRSFVTEGDSRLEVGSSELVRFRVGDRP